METVCIKYQILFSGKNKKNINLSSAELAQRTVKVKYIQSEFEVLHNIDLFQNFLQRLSTLLRGYINIRV